MRSQADAAPAWVFAPDLGDAGSEVVLSAEESHYLARVCRARPGDQFEATNGLGGRARLILSDTRSPVRARVDVRTDVERDAVAEVWCGAPDGQRGDWLIEKLAELGVAVWQPIDCERAVWREAAVRSDRWERLAIAALKQSQRPYLMEIKVPRPLHQLLDSTPADARGWWCDVEGRDPGPTAAPGRSIGVVGPAAGLSEKEKERLASADFASIALSSSRLRTETAAVAWSVLWGRAHANRAALPGP